ncbi:MAG: hypothetical protein AABY64_06965 [Bdellovibrionota bacterium]
MLKSILIIFVMLFGVGINALAAPQPAPTLMLEDEDDSTFYNVTRLKCVSGGVHKLTGKDPSERYLAALALQARNTPMDANAASLDHRLSDRETINRVRYSYLASVVDYVSTYGVCYYNKADKGSYKENKTNMKPLTNFIVSKPEKTDTKVKRENHEAKLNQLTEIIFGQKNYELLDTLFPRTAQEDDEEKEEHIFKNLKPETQKQLAIKGIKEAKSELNTLIGKNDPFFGCVEELEKYQETGGLKSSGKLVTPYALCTSMMTNCGYPAPAYCKKFDDRKDAPAGKQEGHKGGS